MSRDTDHLSQCHLSLLQLWPSAPPGHHPQSEVSSFSTAAGRDLTSDPQPRPRLSVKALLRDHSHALRSMPREWPELA